ncbi:MAG: DUF58 domain-containing protein [Gemmatimonadetes bacterium]|nr:DUF58 domain-containing protein [Gemmatimonadota bacterium]
MSSHETFLDPVLLARISDLPLLARTVVDGFMHGLHRSAKKGLSLDFAEHRQYQPGDDLRRIDWKAYARTDRFYVKEYEADTNAGVLFALDVSASMDYASGAVNKFAYARMLVAALAWLTQRQGDRVGLATFSDRLIEVIPPSTRHLQLLFHALGRAKPTGEGKLPLAIDRVADVATRPGIVVLVTDCYDEPAALGRSVDALRARGHDVLLFHLLDSAEEDFPFDAAAVFEDGESGLRLPLRPEDLKERYQTMWRGHRAALEKRFAAAGVDYIAVRTDAPLDRALYAYLDHRLSRSRVR